VRARGDATPWLLLPLSTDPVRARYCFHDEVPPSDTFNEKEVAMSCVSGTQPRRPTRATASAAADASSNSNALTPNVAR